MQHTQEIVETWIMNNKSTLYLLESISARLDGKGRTIGEQFVHINNIRSMWINKVGEKIDLKLGREKSGNQNDLKIGLELSSEKMAGTLANLFDENAAKSYKPHPTAFFA